MPYIRDLTVGLCLCTYSPYFAPIPVICPASCGLACLPGWMAWLLDNPLAWTPVTQYPRTGQGPTKWLTLYMSNFFRKCKLYLHFISFVYTNVTGSWLCSFSGITRTLSFYCQYHGCKWPGSVCHQDINNHGIDPVLAYFILRMEGLNKICFSNLLQIHWYESWRCWWQQNNAHLTTAEIILWCYNVTSSLIGWAHTQNDSCNSSNFVMIWWIFFFTGESIASFHF